jgi:tRNA 2-thiouridine synthesizing protein A
MEGQVQRPLALYRPGAGELLPGETAFIGQAGSTPKLPMRETVLNLRGLKCPLPALKTRKALSRMCAGERLLVECTDPLAAVDIPNLIRETGDSLEETTQADSSLLFRIRKSGPSA